MSALEALVAILSVFALATAIQLSVLAYLVAKQPWIRRPIKFFIILALPILAHLMYWFLGKEMFPENTLTILEAFLAISTWSSIVMSIQAARWGFHRLAIERT
jgi:hypothetical protein